MNTTPEVTIREDAQVEQEDRNLGQGNCREVEQLVEIIYLYVLPSASQIRDQPKRDTYMQDIRNIIEGHSPHVFSKTFLRNY